MDFDLDISAELEMALQVLHFVICYKRIDSIECVIPQTPPQNVCLCNLLFKMYAYTIHSSKCMFIQLTP